MPRPVVWWFRVLVPLMVLTACENPEAKATRLRTELLRAELLLAGKERMARGVSDTHVNYRQIQAGVDSAVSRRDVAQRNFNRFMNGR